MLKWRKRGRSCDEPRGEVDDESIWSAVQCHKPFQHLGEQLEPGGRGPFGRRQPQSAKKFVGIGSGYLPAANDTEAPQQIERNDIGITGLAQFLAQGSGQGRRDNLSGRNLVCLQIPNVSREDELTSQRKEAKQIANPTRLVKCYFLHTQPQPSYSYEASVGR